jgi:outer membrane protein OmpA-like peptidoglycan-associated protein
MPSEPRATMVSSREDANFMIVSLPSRGFGAAALAFGLLLAGCSSDSDVPPTEVSAPGGGTQMNTDTGSGGTFPDINTVPNQRPTSTIQDLVQAPDGLGAAPGGTQYGEALVGGPTSSVEPPAPPPPPPEDALVPIPEPGIQTQTSDVQPQPVESEPVQRPAPSSEPVATPEIVEPEPMEPVAAAEPEPAPSSAGEGQTIQGTTAEPAPAEPAVAAQPEPMPAAPEESAVAAPQPDQQPSQSESEVAATPGEAQAPSVGSNDPAAYGIEVPQPAPSDGGADMAAAPPAAAPGAPVDARPVGMIYFRDGSSSLSSDDLDVVRQIAEMQRAYGGVLSVVGHASTGTTSPDEANQQISEARANAVAQELMKYGVPQSAIRTSGAGTSQPLNVDATPSSAAANRRAEVYLTAN